MISRWDLASGYDLQFAIENGPVEIVDLPIFIAWWFSSSLRKRLPGRVSGRIRPVIGLGTPAATQLWTSKDGQ